MSFLSTLQESPPRARGRQKPPGVGKPKRKTYRLKILKSETEVTRNPYKKSSDTGFTFTEPMVLLLKLQAEEEHGVRCYFTHRLEFTRSRGHKTGDSYARDQTDFITLVPAAGGGSLVRARYLVGDTITVSASEEEKVSGKGTYYLKLSRVKVENGQLN